MRKYLKIFVTLCTLLFALAICAHAADFTGYTAISNADDLLALMNSTSAVTGKYYLTKDINITGKTQSPIGEPNGKSFGLSTEATTIFDGNGYTVKGVNISGGAYTGFFGVVDNAEIRNLTIEGKVTATANNCGALVAYAKTKIVIENCTNNCSVESSGVYVAGILGNNELSGVNPMSVIKISGCTNNGTIKASRVAGGIVGLIQRPKNCTITIEKCTNNGKVTATSTSADSKIGGILGASNRGDASTPVEITSFTITKCLNTAEISGYFTIGGIVGEFTGTDTSTSGAKYHVTECMNSAKITSSRTSSGQYSYTGGIIGYGSKIGDITDCLNTGDIYVQLPRAGGLFGLWENNFLGASNNLNRATMYLKGAVASHDNVNSIGGYLQYKPYGTNYYTGTLQGKVWTNTTTNAKSTEYKATLFTDLNESGNWTNPDEPTLVAFTAVVCRHEKVSFVKSGSSIVFSCASCEEKLYTDTTVITDVYVNYDSGILASSAMDIGMASAPFKSIEEAFNYVAVAAEIKSSNATITISGKAVLEDTFQTPTTQKTITVKGGNFHYGGALIANRHLNLGGPVVFENVTFTSAAVEARINAQNNKLVMGEGIVMANASSTAQTNSSLPFKVNNVKMFVSGGFYENIPATMATDITIRSGEYYVVSGFNYTNSTAATKGTAKLTVGKTNESDTLKICDLVAFSTVAQTRLTADSTATIIIDGAVDIGRLMMSEREKTANEVEANYITNLVIRGAISESYRDAYHAPYGFDVTGGSHTEASLGYHTFNIYTDRRVSGAVLAEYAFFGGDGYTADETLVSGGYKPVSEGGDTTMTKHSYMEYCAEYLGGHNDGDSDTLCDECGAKTNCEHENVEHTTVKEANCTEKGYETLFCHECGTMVYEGETDIDENAHIYAWEVTDSGYRYVCVHNAEHVYCTYGKAVTAFYVSDNGKADGGFSASYPSNDFDSVMRLAAASDKDVTVYILGYVTLENNSGTDYEMYIEPSHSNRITIRGYGENSGIITIGTRNKRIEYMLSGDTTFEQMEFDTRNSTGTFYITANHHRLVMGERITTTFGRHTSTSSNGGKLAIIGGCDATVDKSSCTKTTTDITLKSGMYYMVIGGSSSKACGLASGTININVLGDITVGGVVTSQNGYVDRQFILGSHSANAGDINFTVDGVVTCINALCVGSYGTQTVNNESVCRTAGDVTITVKSGTVIDYSFSGRSERAHVYDDEFAQTYDPTASNLGIADVVVFPLGNSHTHAIRGGVMKTLDSLHVSYNSNDDSAVDFAKRLRLSLGGADNFSMEVISGTPCTSANGRHTALGAGTVVLEATCRGEGSIEYTCATCSKKYTTTIERLPHDFSTAKLSSEANCTSPAIYVSVCQNENCGFKNYEKVGAPTGTHVFENGVCKYCNLSKQTLCNHENLSDAEEFVSGCGVGTKVVCLDCEKEFITIDGADHKFGKYTVTVEPTETTPGVKSRTCRSCGKVETALLYAEGSVAAEAVATNADGSLSDVSVDTLKLSSVEKAALNALLQDSEYGSEVKVSYSADGAVANMTYSIPLPAAYEHMHNLKIVVKDDEGKLHTVDFKIEKGYIVFEF